MRVLPQAVLFSALRLLRLRCAHRSLARTLLRHLEEMANQLPHAVIRYPSRLHRLARKRRREGRARDPGLLELPLPASSVPRDQRRPLVRVPVRGHNGSRMTDPKIGQTHIL